MRPDPVFDNLKVYNAPVEPVPEARPCLEDFGLTNDIDFEKMEAEYNEARRRAQRYEGFFTNIGGIVLFGGIIFSMISGAREDENTPYYFAATCISAFLFLNIPERFFKVHRDPILVEFLAYKAALSQWEQHEERKRLDFWRNSRGTAFEREIAKLFTRFKWHVATTPTTGDRGVDLVVTSDGQTFWCQCKGQAKPVAGAEVRRIAGATLASNGRALPVLIASNGFTKPALNEARDLKVICIDGITLSQVARRAAAPTALDELDIVSR